MNNWLIINLQAVRPEVAEAQQSQANHPGACHDGVNHVYTWISPEAEAIATTLPDELEDPAAYIGHHLATQAAPLIAPKAVLSALFRTPAWRLWCATYEDWRDLEQDHEAVFNVGVDGRKPIEELNTQARESIRQWGESLS